MRSVATVLILVMAGVLALSGDAAARAIVIDAADSVIPASGPKPEATAIGEEEFGLEPSAIAAVVAMQVLAVGAAVALLVGLRPRPKPVQQMRKRSQCKQAALPAPGA